MGLECVSYCRVAKQLCELKSMLKSFCSLKKMSCTRQELGLFLLWQPLNL